MKTKIIWVMFFCVISLSSVSNAEQLVYSTFFGGSGDDHGENIAIDSVGNAYILGDSGDIFIFKLDSTGSVLLYSTTLGGIDSDNGNGIAVDSIGNVYICGATGSENFPTTSNAFDTSFNGGFLDAFVSKLSADGTTLIYSTFIGGSDAESAKDIAIDSAGNIYICGYTESTNFPVTLGAFDSTFNGGTFYGDAFVSKLDPANTNLVYSTYLGGIGMDIAYAIAIDSDKNAYVTGPTASDNFPVTIGSFDTTHESGTFDVFISKLNQSGTDLIFSTFIGGSSDEESYDVAVDNTGSSYITGYTISTDFPVTANAFQQINQGWLDVFVSKLNPNGSALVYSTYLGGSEMYEDIGYGIALDSCGNVYIAGETQSTDFPISHNAWDETLNGNNDVFISKLNTTGSLLLYSTFLGGSSREQSSAIKGDNDGNIFITGYTESPDFPTTFGSFDTSHNGNRDVFVSKLNILPSPTGIDSLLWKSYSK